MESLIFLQDVDPMLDVFLNNADLQEEQQKLPNYVSKYNDTELALASITPLLPTSGLFGINETCASQSRAYLEGLFSNSPDKIWAKKSKIGGRVGEVTLKM